jgi:hypothetical protein
MITISTCAVVVAGHWLSDECFNKSQQRRLRNNWSSYYGNFLLFYYSKELTDIIHSVVTWTLLVIFDKQFVSKTEEICTMNHKGY